MPTHICPDCGIVKDVACFAPDPSKKVGRRFICRPCDAARQRNAYAPREVKLRGPSPVPSYGVLHRRLRKARGPASRQRCIGCGGVAAHWAYDRDDPAELVGDTGRGITAAYSLHFEHYRPLCRSCHTKDQGARLRREIEVLRVALWLALLHRYAAAEAGRPAVKIKSVGSVRMTIGELVDSLAAAREAN